MPLGFDSFVPSRRRLLRILASAPHAHPPMPSRSLYSGQRSCIPLLSSVPSPLQLEETSLQPALQDFLSEAYYDLGVPRPDDTSLHKLSLAIMCMERQVALALDRPWFIPEPASIPTAPIVCKRASDLKLSQTLPQGDERATGADSPVEICWSLLPIQCLRWRRPHTQSGCLKPAPRPRQPVSSYMPLAPLDIRGLCGLSRGLRLGRGR